MHLYWRVHTFVMVLEKRYRHLCALEPGPVPREDRSLYQTTQKQKQKGGRLADVAFAHHKSLELALI